MISKQKSAKWGNLLLGFSPWILAAACGLLLLLLLLFSVSNYQREKELIMEALVQKGLTLMRFINSSARESVRQNLRTNSEWVSWDKHVQAAIEQAMEQPGIEFIAIVDSSGRVLAGAAERSKDGMVDSSTRAFISGLNLEPFDHFVSRVVETADGGHAFQIAARYLPPNGPGFMPDPDDERGPRRHQMMMRRFSDHPNFASIVEEMRKLIDEKPIYVVQLDLEQFNTPLHRQLLQVVILLVVTLLVGAGGALSFMTLKGLRGSQQRLGVMRAFTDNLVSSLPIGVAATDSKGRMQICNEAASEILGLQNRGSLAGLPPEDVLPTELAKLLHGDNGGRNRTTQHDLILKLPKGERSLQVAAFPLYNDNGDFAGDTLIMRDQTEMRRLEKDLERSERLAALGKMAAGVAHELRNPLSSIKGLAVLLKKSVDPGAKNTDTADILVREVDRLNRSIGELLDYAKPGSLTKEPVAFAEFIDKTVSLVRMDTESYGIDIVVQVAEALPSVMIDRDKMSQVLLNLMLNSIQAMPEGGELRLEAQINNDGKIVLRVSDTGHGIDKENLGKVLDPYFTTKSNGTGLGLALSTKIIEEHGGKIKISSVPGKSTCVEVVLPAAEGA